MTTATPTKSTTTKPITDVAGRNYSFPQKRDSGEERTDVEERTENGVSCVLVFVFVNVCVYEYVCVCPRVHIRVCV